MVLTAKRGSGWSCGAVLQCADGCASDECVRRCQDEATPIARALFEHLQSCVQNHDCRTLVCREHQCEAEVNLCQVDDSGTEEADMDAYPRGNDVGAHPQEGSQLSCNGVFDCFEDCALRDRLCMNDCFELGSQVARDAVDALSACLRAHACESHDCMRDACGPEMSACDALDGDADQGHARVDPWRTTRPTS